MFNPVPMQPAFQPQMNPAYGISAGLMPINQSSSDSTLYVGNLSPFTDETRLHSLFHPYGNILTAKIMRDLYNQESRRFGFVSFATVEEALKAKEALNYQKVDNFEIRICFKKLTSDFKEGANLFIKNIPKTVSTKQLDDLFSECGKIVSCSIRTDNKGVSLGYGYVQLETEEMAEAARLKFNGSTRFEQPISVEKFVSSKLRPAIKNNLYVKNFPQSWDKAKIEAMIAELFGSVGKIISSGVNEYKRSTGEVSFYAFVAFDTQEEAKKAIEDLNEKKLEGVAEEETGIFVGYAEPKSLRVAKLKKEYASARNTTNLFLKSLLETVTEEQIKTVLSKFGEITSVCVRSSQPPFLPPGQSIKCAFVNFKTSEGATNALLGAKKDEEIKALIHPIHKKNVDFIVYHQSKTNRMEYMRMKLRIHQSMQFSNMPPYMIPTQMAGSFKKNQHFGGQHPFGGPMGGIPFGFPNQGKFIRPDGNMKFQGGLPVHTPPTVKNSNSGSTSRQGEDEEVFNLEYLKTHKDEFMGFDKERQNNILGNLMYHKVMESGLSNKDLAPKITGMLIDLDILEITEIIEIMENKESLNERVNEALEVINSNED